MIDSFLKNPLPKPETEDTLIHLSSSFILNCFITSFETKVDWVGIGDPIFKPGCITNKLRVLCSNSRYRFYLPTSRNSHGRIFCEGLYFVFMDQLSQT